MLADLPEGEAEPLQRRAPRLSPQQKLERAGGQGPPEASGLAQEGEQSVEVLDLGSHTVRRKRRRRVPAGLEAGEPLGLEPRAGESLYPPAGWSGFGEVSSFPPSWMCRSKAAMVSRCSVVR